MNNVIFPLASPQFLTESLFITAGFFTGTANNWQINTAFSIAESMIAREIGTFLVPTTGIYVQHPFVGFQQYELPVGNIIGIEYVKFRETYQDGSIRYISGSAVILDAELGYISPFISTGDISSCNCHSSVIGIESMEIWFSAGYMSGVANSPITNPLIQLAACMAADQVMKQMYDEGIGVYAENMVKTRQIGRIIESVETKGFFGNTIFGPSSRGQYIKNILEPYKIRKAGRLSGRTQRKIRGG